VRRARAPHTQPLDPPQGAGRREEAVMAKAKPIPEGMHSLTPNLVFKDAAQAIDWYVRAFGATEVLRIPGPFGKIMHAELKIGDSHLFLNDEFPGSGVQAPGPASPPTSSVMLYVPDVDAAFQRAVQLGARSAMPVMDAFWGDRGGMLVDPFGYPWFIATRVKDLSAEEMRRASEEAVREMEAAAAARSP
jgi:uncharacterized glyoxalase superfamily protein PhnB